MAIIWKRMGYICSALLTSLILISCNDSVTVDSKLYIKDGFRISLPQGWDVFDDHQASESSRSLSIASDAGNFLLVNIYPKLQGDFPVIPPVGEYLKSYVLQAIPSQEARDSAKFDYGVVARENLEGLYADIRISKPQQQHLFIESLRYEDPSFVVFFTFTTPAPVPPEVDNFINQITADFSINSI